MWELDYKESWAPKNWCFWTVVLEKTLEHPWTARRSNQSILKETSPGCSLEGLMLRLKLQYFGHLIQRVDSLEKTLMLGGTGGRRRRGCRGWDGWMASLTRWTWVSVNSGSWWWTGRPGVLQFMGSQRVRHDWATDLIWCCRTKTSGTNSSGLIQQLTESPPLPVWITLVFLSALWGSFSQDNKLTLSTQVSTG